jgi:hypothetical protein
LETNIKILKGEIKKEKINIRKYKNVKGKNNKKLMKLMGK